MKKAKPKPIERETATLDTPERAILVGRRVKDKSRTRKAKGGQ